MRAHGSGQACRKARVPGCDECNAYARMRNAREARQPGTHRYAAIHNEGAVGERARRHRLAWQRAQADQRDKEML